MNYNTVLSEMKTGKLTYGDLVEAIKKSGVEEGDTICVHSDLIRFGTFKLPRNEYMQAYIDALLEVIGESGILIMPTFSYSFCHNEIYNVQETKSTVGILTEYFRTLPKVTRTLEPIFSFGIYGKQIEKYLDIGKECFSRDSMYGKLVDNNAKLVFLGNKKGYTFNHFMEQTTHVPYRFMKRFHGTIIDNNERYDTYRDYYVRYLDQRSVASLEKQNRFLEEKQILNTVNIGTATISCAEAVKWYEEAEKEYKQNPYFLLKDE